MARLDNTPSTLDAFGAYTLHVRHFVIVTSLAATGCMAATLIDGRADDDVSLVRWRMQRMTILSSCAGGGFGDDCGLVTDLVASRAFREKFAEKRCADLDDSTCAAELAYATKTWMAERYFAAERSAVLRACGLCTPKDYELRLLASHNARVITLGVKDIEAINDRRAQEHRANVQTTMGVLNGLAGLAGGMAR